MKPSSPATLFIVPTPIGNLGDFTFRAVKVLKAVDLILTEDTRTTRTLTQHYGINTPRQAFHLHNEHHKVKYYHDLLLSGKNIALVSDAGTPGIADVGYLLVREAIHSGIEVTTLPGATALIPALIMSGLPCHHFFFEGFLPHKKGRQTRLRYLATLEETIILYESPHRIEKTLGELINHLGEERQASLSREISKKFEENIRGSLYEIFQEVKERGKLKGEIVLCLRGKD